MPRDATIRDQQKLLRNLGEDFQMPARGRVQAQHHQPALGLRMVASTSPTIFGASPWLGAATLPSYRQKCGTRLDP